MISWSRKTLHPIFLKYWVGHFFIWKELIKLMGISEVTLLNKKWEQDLTANLIYIPGWHTWVRLMKWSSKWSSKRTAFCVGFILFWFTKQFHCLLWSGFSMGTWKVAIITLLASFKFSGVFINHCSANMLQTKESTHKKDNNQNSVVEKYFFDYKKEMV